MPPLYGEVCISGLAPGPGNVSFTGWIVNVYDQNIQSEMPEAAKGCLKLLIKDDCAMVLVKLWYAEPYEFRLGSLLTISTTHVSSTSAIGEGAPHTTSPTSIFTSIFPERDTGCKIEERWDKVCRTPNPYVSGYHPMGLMTLEAFTGNAGDEVPDAKILVCVTNIGQRQTSTSKRSAPMTALAVGICDQTCHAILTLYPPLASSAQEWEASKTILLITSAKGFRGRRITTTSRTQIEVSPDTVEAASLRRSVQQESCPINEAFPDNIFDVEALETSPQRLQFTLASLHCFIDAAPTKVYSGYLSVILAELRLTSLYTKQRMFSMECCGMPVYGNTLRDTCRQCTKELQLRINPDLVGEIADETGAICSGSAPTSTENVPSGSQRTRKNSKVLWSDEAWANLLGRTPKEFADWLGWFGEGQGQIGLLQALEHRLSYMRVVMMIGWTGEYEGGRLAILKIVQ